MTEATISPASPQAVNRIADSGVSGSAGVHSGRTIIYATFYAATIPKMLVLTRHQDERKEVHSMGNTLVRLCLTSLLVFLAETVSATIVSGEIIAGSTKTGGATFIKLSVPFTVSKPANTVGSNTFNKPHLYGFDEDQNIVIARPLAVDIIADAAAKTIINGTLPPGTEVASHYIFFDPRRKSTQVGKVTFDSKVLGVITSMPYLQQSDRLANSGVIYQNPGFRGLEKQDKVVISDPYSITVNWRASSPGDYIRVITESSPGAVFLGTD